MAKDKIVSDLSEQLKESEDRIQDLLLESEGSRRVSREKEREHEENLGRIIMAIEDEYKDTIKMQQEQVRETGGSSGLTKTLTANLLQDDFFPNY